MPKKKKAVLSPEAKKYFADAGKAGAKKRWKGTTAKQRKEVARKMVEAKRSKAQGKTLAMHGDLSAAAKMHGQPRRKKAD